MRLIIKGQIKSGKNNMVVTRQGRHFPKKAWEIWRNGVLAQILEQGPHKRLETAGRVIFEYYPGDLRRRDAPGMIDALFHCFERSGVVSDDALFQHVVWIQYPIDRLCPRAIVKIDALCEEKA